MIANMLHEFTGRGLTAVLGVIIGAAAGALGGWWAGHTVSDVLEDFSDTTYRRTHREQTGRDDFESVRDFYRFGHLAGSNPDYQGRSFEQVEPDLRRSWPRDAGDWEEARDYIESAYNRRD